MRLEDFDYDLPETLIAQRALADRAASRLMVVDRNDPFDRARPVRAHAVFRDLPDYLDENDILVLNRSRVVPARLLLERETGGVVELLFLGVRGDDRFEAWVRPLARMKEGEVLAGGDARYRFRFLKKTGERSGLIRFEPMDAGSAGLENALEEMGHVPLPPYIRRPDEPGDRERYQTVYAREKGSVAAPTAGLHFDEALLDELKRRGVAVVPLVLHVGPGTFSPLDCGEVEANRLQSEMFEIPASTIETLREGREAGKRVVAVGTTVTRALESAGAMGWFDTPPPDHGRAAATNLFVYPGYRFEIVDRLITNFHLPRSSLLLLVCAFLGRERTLACYRTAVETKYRFYSYGDAMLIL